MQYDRFTDRARKVMSYARQAARAWRHEFIGTEHILAGLLDEGAGVAAKVLKDLNVDWDDLRGRIVALAPPGREEVAKGPLPFTPGAKQALEYSVSTASEWKHNYIGTEHLLMGLLREAEGVAARALIDGGADYATVKAAMHDLLGVKTVQPHPGEQALLKQMTRFWRQFGILISSGVPILEALKIQEAEAEQWQVRDAVGRIWRTIEGGKPMSAALQEVPSLFSAGVIALCRAGEHGGVLDVVAERIAKGLENGALALSTAEEGEAVVGQATESAGVVDRVSGLLEDAVKSRASDIHFEPTDDGGRIRLRIDGVLSEYEALDDDAYNAVITRLMIMANLDIAEKRRPVDGRIRINLANKDLDLRCSMMPYVTRTGRKGSMVIRILDTSAPVLELDRICDGEVLETVREWARRSNGVHIVSGPTGSGKTTMLYSVLLAATTPERKVMAVENPVEYLLPGVLQAEVRANIGCTFPVLIRSQLRQDPDVLMIGEIQDRETAMLLPAISMTGHLVFTTLHTETSTEIPRRLVDIGLAPWLVKVCLSGAMGMRLVRKVCSDCREHSEAAPLDVLSGLPDEQALKSAAFVRGRGCERCNGTGYRGRIAVYETLPMTPEIRDMIGENVPPSDLREAAVETGMVTMRHDGCRKAAAGLTTLEEVSRVTYGIT